MDLTVFKMVKKSIKQGMREYADESLKKGYLLYVYYSINGYYSFNAVDPMNVNIKKFLKKGYAYENKLYSSYEEVERKLSQLNKIKPDDIDVEIGLKKNQISEIMEFVDLIEFDKLEAIEKLNTAHQLLDEIETAIKEAKPKRK